MAARQASSKGRSDMTDVLDQKAVGDFLDGVRRLVARRIEGMRLPGQRHPVPSNLMPGKMLRSRFGARLAAAAPGNAEPAALERACAATEILHTATLCHDDVIDNALIRRAGPTLWKVTGPSAAVMIGDWLLCDSVQVARQIDGGAYLGAFLDKVQETCRAETEHEMTVPGERLDADTCMRLARGKAGALFSFIGYVCGGSDPALREALEEAGYSVGTAYQLADDILDVVGHEDEAGKTLGTDAARGKFTISQEPVAGPALAQYHVAEQCRSALTAVDRWPDARAGVETFLREDLLPVFGHLGASWDIAAEAAG